MSTADGDGRQAQFFRTLVALAQLCGVKLEEPIVMVYDASLSKYGYDRLCKTMQELIVNRRARDPFPSIPDFKELLGDFEASDETKARDAAARIVAAVSRYGYNNAARAREYVGEIGWYVVGVQGGWENVCSVLTDSNKATLQAQWRDLAFSAIEKDKTGRLELPPAFKSAMTGKDTIALPQAVRLALDEAEKGVKQISSDP